MEGLDRRRTRELGADRRDRRDHRHQRFARPDEPPDRSLLVGGQDRNGRCGRLHHDREAGPGRLGCRRGGWRRCRPHGQPVHRRSGPAGMSVPAVHHQPDVPAAEASRNRWIALAFIAVAQLMIALDATIVSIALPSAQAALGASDARPAVGRHRLHALVWRAAPPGRPDRRLRRTQAGVPDRSRRLRGRVDDRRRGAELRCPGRGARAAGSLRRPAGADGPLAARGHVHAAARARDRLRRVRIDRRQRRRDRPAARRRADAVPHLALVPLSSTCRSAIAAAIGGWIVLPGSSGRGRAGLDLPGAVLASPRDLGALVYGCTEAVTSGLAIGAGDRLARRQR